jgi:hypothetical protein
MSLLAILLASQLSASSFTLTAADQTPTLDFEPGCRDSLAMGDGMQTLQSCEIDEKAARDLLAKQWSGFAQSDKAMCVDMTKNFDPSYVELLSCLEMMRDAKEPANGTQSVTSPHTR